MTTGPRKDGRAYRSMRPVSITPHYLPHAEGSALINFGTTRVLCAASVEERVPPFLSGKGQGWVTAEYAMLPRATHSRTPRESAQGKIGGRTHEIQRLIGRSLRAAINLDKLGERTITLDCDVIIADGGTRTAAITGAYVALALACQNLQTHGKLKALPLVRGNLAAVSVGIIGGVPMLDLDYSEDSRAGVDCNVVMFEGGQLVEVQGTAEGAPFARAELNTMLDLAETGLRELYALQRAAIALPR